MFVDLKDIKEQTIFRNHHKFHKNEFQLEVESSLTEGSKILLTGE
jgi:hypothetical protein